MVGYQNGRKKGILACPANSDILLHLASMSDSRELHHLPETSRPEGYSVTKALQKVIPRVPGNVFVAFALLTTMKRCWKKWTDG